VVPSDLGRDSAADAEPGALDYQSKARIALRGVNVGTDADESAEGKTENRRVALNHLSPGQSTRP